MFKTEQFENEQWEKYCSLRALGTKIKDAYIVAGFAEANASQGAQRLEKNTEIQARIAFLRDEYIKENSHIERYFVIDQIKKAVARLEVLAMTAKKEIDKVNANKILLEKTLELYKVLETISTQQKEESVKEMSTEELQKIINSLNKEAGVK